VYSASGPALGDFFLVFSKNTDGNTQSVVKKEFFNSGDVFGFVGTEENTLIIRL
jgi:hypothetical protein